MEIDFLDDLEAYLEETIKESNSNFSNLVVKDAYDFEKEIHTPQISVWIDDNLEDETSNSYDKENISTIPINIYCYGEAMCMNNDSKKTTAFRVSTILSEEVKKALDKNKHFAKNNNIISSTRLSYTGALNIENSNIYVSIFRYEFKIKNNYTKIYNNSI